VTPARRLARFAGIYAIVNESERAIEIARGALVGGIRVIQYRAKNGIVPDRLHSLRALTRARGAMLVLDDDWRAAVAFECDGVHLGPGDDGFSEAENIVRACDGIAVGFSCGTEEEARAASRAGAAYVGVGCVYPTRSKDDAGEPIGLAGLRRIAAAASVPVAAIGGITRERIGEIRATGVAMAAVIGALADAPDAAAAARDLVAAWNA
jgi:thiamine-phosphate pyrophosphorylase